MLQADRHVVVIGAGPAGLFASECLLKKGIRVSLYDQMPSALSKFVVAGSRGGLNITHRAPSEVFASCYGENEKRFDRYLKQFSPTDLQTWLAGLGVKTCTGSSGKIFPQGVSASEIRDRWLAQLQSREGFTFFPKHRLTGIRNRQTLIFETVSGDCDVRSETALFALGGASWSATGSDGRWAGFFENNGIGVSTFESANCGFEADWSPFLKKEFAHVWLKNICLTFGEKTVRGELILTPYGMEGGVVYTLGSSIRKTINQTGACTVFLDLMRDWPVEKIMTRLDEDRKKDSMANHFRKKLNLSGPALALLRENATDEQLRDSRFVSRLLKHLPVTLRKPRPLEEAISTAGGVCFSGLDDHLMLKAFPGWFCAGEMLDWEAPTGGFLMQGCFSTAYQAALGVANWLDRG
ncbi:MAG: TIGR03862 family flavoprotein [Smithellaceae bacterium]